jgi:hypothetical protein
VRQHQQGRTNEEDGHQHHREPGCQVGAVDTAQSQA